MYKLFIYQPLPGFVTTTGVYLTVFFRGIPGNFILIADKNELTLKNLNRLNPGLLCLLVAKHR